MPAACPKKIDMHTPASCTRGLHLFEIDLRQISSVDRFSKRLHDPCTALYCTVLYLVLSKPLQRRACVASHAVLTRHITPVPEANMSFATGRKTKGNARQGKPRQAKARRGNTTTGRWTGGWVGGLGRGEGRARQGRLSGMREGGREGGKNLTNTNNPS